MSSPRPLSRRMMRIVPENGYESPQSSQTPENSGFFFGITDAERKRTLGSLSCDSGEDTGVDDNSETQNTSPAKEADLESGNIPAEKIIGLRDRVGCFTWTWFTLTMATGGIANVIHSIPYQSEWLHIIGVIVFLFNIVLFLVLCSIITLRFRWNPGSFTGSIKSPSESLFVPASIISIGTILINISQYGIPKAGEWLQTAMQICFWAYCALGFLTSSGLYLIMWSTQTFPIHTMTPIWIFPAYPLLLIAPFAANVIDNLPTPAAATRINAISITFGAICIQGTGFLVSLMIYSAFIYRLMTQKLPRETTRPGMFVSVGPSGFTVAGIVQLGSTVMPKVLPSGFEGHTDAAFIIKLASDLAGLWMWGLCLWFFFVSVGAHWQLTRPHHPQHHIQFEMTWYSFVFPNTALVTATIALGKSFNSPGLKILGTVLAAILVVVWIFVFSTMLRALYQRRLLWPGQIDGAEASQNRWIGKTGDATASGMNKIRSRASQGRK